MQPPEPADAGLVDYYRRRASEYEAIYAKPERQADLAVLRTEIPQRLRGKRVLELACGTGYWTGLIAEQASSVLATDLAEEPMRIAQAKSYPRGNVGFAAADAYALPGELGSFDAAFAGFWWSHVPAQRIDEFLASLHGRLGRNAAIVMLDNRFVPGSSSPLAGADAEGNTYQMRDLADGSRLRVLKNFPSEDGLRARLSGCAATIRFEALEYYWLLEYRLA